MNPLFPLIAYWIGRNMRRECECEDKEETSFSSEGFGVSCNDMLTLFYGLLVGMLAFWSATMSGPFDMSQPAFVNAMAMFMPAIETLAAMIIFSWKLTEASSRAVMLALALGAIVLAVIWLYWLTGELALLNFWERQGLALLPAFSMVATTYLLHRFSASKD